MSRKQKGVLIAAAAATVVLLLFPPYFMSYPARHAGIVEFWSGYRFLLAPVDPESLRRISRIDVTLLLMQWLAIWAVAAVAWLLLRMDGRPDVVSQSDFRKAKERQPYSVEERNPMSYSAKPTEPPLDSLGPLPWESIPKLLQALVDRGLAKRLPPKAHSSDDSETNGEQ